MARFVLAIDQGTTSSRAIVYDDTLTPRASAQQEFAQHYPQEGWVEHDPSDLWRTVLACARQAITKAGLQASDIATIGITNQRETTLVWDRATGEPVYPAIVWQDRRTMTRCEQLKASGLEAEVRARTGLLLDPYFSATKLAWILDEVPGARERAEAGKLIFGTVDTWLIWHLTGAKQHVTDATNAARTMLYNIHEGCWDRHMLSALNIPEAMLPEVRDCAGEFGDTQPELLGASVPIRGVAGDQQAATVGQACFEPGMLKSTYGTGCFALLNTGAQVITSENRLLTTIAYQLGGQPTYALEGSIFVAGALVQWLRDELGLIEKASQTQAMAEAADPSQRVYLVPAFTGLGAPYWQAGARGSLLGMTRNTGPNEIARAGLQAIGYQTSDLMKAMVGDWPALADMAGVLRVDGGLVANDYAMQFLADILGRPVERPQNIETTALGAAALAALGVGLLPDLGALQKNWRLERRFDPSMASEARETGLKGWAKAIAATQLMAEE